MAVTLVCGSVSAFAQEADAPYTSAEWMVWQPDPAGLTLPDVQFTETRLIAGDYANYSYSHRPGTSFAEALADIRECDLRARRLWQSPDPASEGSDAARRQDEMANSPASAIAGPLAGWLVSAIAGPAEARQARRFGLRRCMFFKAYARYGLPEDLWRRFNYDATQDDLTEQQRQTMLARQALLASGPTPQAQELGL